MNISTFLAGVVPKGDPPQISLTSIIDRYLYSLDESVENHIKVKLGGPRPQGVFHPSELCKSEACDRSMAYEIYSAPRKRDNVDARLRRIFHNGTFTHCRLQHVIEKAVARVGGRFADEVKCPPGALLVAGTTDGVLELNNWFYMLEIKSMNSRQFKELGKLPWDDHLDQVNIYMKLAGLRGAIILIENKDNQDLREYFVRFSQERWNRCQERVERVLFHKKQKTLPPKITEADGCTGARCGFYAICKGKEQHTWSPNNASVEARKTKTGVRFKLSVAA